MAIVKPIVIGADGEGAELNPATDDLSAQSFGIDGSSVALSGTGLELDSQAITGSGNISFNDSAVNTVNGIIADDLMSEAAENVMQSGSAIQFGTVGDVAGELDAFVFPTASAQPTQTPTAGGSAAVVYQGELWIWDGSAWNNTGIAESASAIDLAFTANGAIADRDCVYISADDAVSPALGVNNVNGQYRAIGFAMNAAADTAAVTVRDRGIVDGVLTGATAGDVYFLSTATAGAVTSTVPTGAGNRLVQVGKAKNATDLLIGIEMLRTLLRA